MYNHTPCSVDNCKDYEPVVVIKRNNHKPLVVVDAEYFVDCTRMRRYDYKNHALELKGSSTVYTDDKLFRGDGYIASRCL